AARPLSASGMAKLAQESGQTLIVLRVTEAGTFAFIQFSDKSCETVEVPGFTVQRLGELMARFEGEQAEDGWMVAYYDSLRARAQRDPQWQEIHDRWLITLDATLGVVERELLAPIRTK